MRTCIFYTAAVVLLTIQSFIVFIIVYSNNYICFSVHMCVRLYVMNGVRHSENNLFSIFFWQLCVYLLDFRRVTAWRCGRV